MDAMQLRAWVNALSPDEFSSLAARVSALSPLTAFTAALGAGRKEMTDGLIQLYLTEPREALGLLGLSELSALRRLRERPQPLKLRGLSEADRAALEALRRLGLAHRTRAGWLLADFACGLCDLSGEEEQAVREADSLVSLSRGTLLLTGMLPLETLRSRIGLPDSRWASDTLMQTLIRRGVNSRFAMTPRGQWILSDYLRDPIWLYRQVTRAELAETPRADFTGAQALEAAGAVLPVLTPDAVPILRAVGESVGNAGVAGRELLFLAQNMPCAEAAGLFLQNHPDARGTALEEALPGLLRRLPRWANLGYADGEIGRLSLPGVKVN